MADERIIAQTTTTTVAADDYIVMDSEIEGTRKKLASSSTLPNQTDQAGNLLTTDGTTPFWTNIEIGSIAALNAPQALDLAALTAPLHGPAPFQYNYFKVVSGNLTLTEDATTPNPGDGYALMLIGDGTTRVITIPASISLARGSTITRFLLSANSTIRIVRQYTDGAWYIYGDPVLDRQQYTWSFDPKAVCDGAVDRLFLMTVPASMPDGFIFDSWSLSFEADPTTEADLDLKRADAYIGVANSAVMDVCDTTAGVSSESTPGNINGGNPVAAGKVIYLEFGTAYTEAGHQLIFQMTGHPAVE